MGDYTGVHENPNRDAYNNGRIEGRKEVVEFVNKTVLGDFWVWETKEGKAKLKEWRIK